MEAVGLPETCERRTRTVRPGGRVATTSTPVPAEERGTHRFAPGQTEEAYDVFDRAADTGAPEVALGGPQHTAVQVPDPPAAA
ncbi:hypothetical protein [Streptomyces sp. NPDC000961]|uniref:hypothetical protein n=1 Tax=Streptomyces sp. NPDC000961 TaxID=3364541 RepID=UPI003684FC1B